MRRTSSILTRTLFPSVSTWVCLWKALRKKLTPFWESWKPEKIEEWWDREPRGGLPLLLGLKGNFESWIALLITTSQAVKEDKVGSVGWIWFLSAQDRALNGDGRWRGKGCFQFLPCVLDFHSGWLPWLSWNCGFGSEAAARFWWSCTP